MLNLPSFYKLIKQKSKLVLMSYLHVCWGSGRGDELQADIHAVASLGRNLIMSEDRLCPFLPEQQRTSSTQCSDFTSVTNLYCPGASLLRFQS